VQCERGNHVTEVTEAVWFLRLKYMCFPPDDSTRGLGTGPVVQRCWDHVLGIFMCEISLRDTTSNKSCEVCVCV
jgi:hypothetical protein